MSIAAVCKDLGRVVVQEPASGRVEGRTTFEPVPGPWFRCRLFLTSSNDQADAQRAHWSSVPQPQVMTTTVDKNGDALEFRGDQRIDISSRQLGRAVWRMVGEPEPIRKKTRVIGFLFNVERVVEREYDDLLNQQVPHPDAVPV